MLEGRRADYDAQVVALVGKQLGARYGRGFGITNLHRMVKFASVFPDAKIVAARLQQSGWTHFTKDLESAILREIERFLLELGTGFAFVERQKRITLDGDDYFLDLLLFHRRIQRLVAIELKLGPSSPPTPARSNCTCAGSIATSVSRRSKRHSGSSCALARSARRSSTSTSTHEGSASPST